MEPILPIPFILGYGAIILRTFGGPGTLRKADMKSGEGPLDKFVSSAKGPPFRFRVSLPVVYRKWNQAFVSPQLSATVGVFNQEVVGAK